MERVILAGGLEIDVNILGNPCKDLDDALALASLINLKAGVFYRLNEVDGYLSLVSSNGYPLDKDYRVISVRGPNGRIQYLISETNK